MDITEFSWRSGVVHSSRVTSATSTSSALCASGVSSLVCRPTAYTQAACGTAVLRTHMLVCVHTHADLQGHTQTTGSRIDDILFAAGHLTIVQFKLQSLSVDTVDTPQLPVNANA